MLTRCPSCATHFRVMPEQLKARGGRVRCGQCQHVFNALDSLIEEPFVIAAPMGTVAVPPAPTFEQTPDPISRATAVAEPAPEPVPEAPKEFSPPKPERLAAITQPAESAEPVTVEPAVTKPMKGMLVGAERAVADGDATAGATADDWGTSFPEPSPPPRRWPWVIGSLVALAAMVLQALLAFRVELVVLWPQSKPVLVTLCKIAECEVGLPAKVGLVGIEASDLHPDSQRIGLLVLVATLKNRAPFAQQFPHLELTLTDTADQAIARKVLAPTDYLPPATPITNGMKPNADIMVAIGIDSGQVTASGYRLYLFYP